MKPRRNPPPPKAGRRNEPINLDLSLNGALRALTALVTLTYHCEQCRTEAKGTIPPPGFVYHCATCRGPMNAGQLPAQPKPGPKGRPIDVRYEDVTYKRLKPGKPK